MKVAYQETIPLVGVGLTPWMRLGPEKWFPEYKVISAYDWGQNGGAADMPVVITPASVGVEFSAHDVAGTNDFVQHPAFARALRQSVPAPVDVLTSHPVTTPAELQNDGYNFVAMSAKVRDFLENKIVFRRAFGAKLRFPDYTVLSKRNLRPNASEFTRLLSGRSAMVVQDEFSSGARGTYIVRTLEDYIPACKALTQGSHEGNVVVSEYVSHAYERSLQGVVTRYGVFVGPLQKQIVSDPQLANLKVVGAERFCGAEVSPDDRLMKAYGPMSAAAKIIGEKLAKIGYLGIFGVDFMVRTNGDIFVLEANPRFTGVTPLLTMAYRQDTDIPFYLLHILERCQRPYQITDSGPFLVGHAVAMLVLYSHHSSPFKLPRLRSGIYRWDGRSMTFEGIASSASCLATADQIFVEQRGAPGSLIKPGGRMIKLFFKRSILDNHDQILPEIRRIVEAVNSMMS